jgi:hypothetical protein
MGKHIQLSITDPCHENWDSMTKAEQGRFCTSCQKQVVDFTSMSDSQLAAFFKKPIQSLSKDGSVCGRFFQDQLDRNVEIPRKRIPWVKYFFQFALPAFLMSAKAAAQGNVIVKSMPVIAENHLTGLVAIAPKPTKGEISIVKKIEIKGKIVDENNNPVPFASVMIKGKGIGVSADSIGAFSIIDPLFNEAIVLEVSSAGFETKNVSITQQANMSQDFSIQLKAAKMLDEVVVSSTFYIKGRTMITGGISSVRCTKITEAIPVVKPATEKPAMIKVYPNPVLAGTTINIGCEKLEEGYYSFQLFNQAGQMIQSKQIWIDAEARLLNMEIPSVVTGNYFLALTNKVSGKKFTEKIIVE